MPSKREFNPRYFAGKKWTLGAPGTTGGANATPGLPANHEGRIVESQEFVAVEADSTVVANGVVLGGSSGGGSLVFKNSVMLTSTETATYTVPSTVTTNTAILVEIWGSGGGGGGYNLSGGPQPGGAGGSGGFVSQLYLVSPNQVFNYACGVGGTGGAQDFDGINGGLTFFGNTSSGSQLNVSGGSGGIATGQSPGGPGTSSWIGSGAPGVNGQSGLTLPDPPVGGNISATFGFSGYASGGNGGNASVTTGGHGQQGLIVLYTPY